MNQPWLTTIDWPVSAFEPKEARKQGGAPKGKEDEQAYVQNDISE
jgi:hypothetical protein